MSQPLDLNQQRELHKLCCQFEDAWNAGSNPSIEAFLRKTNSENHDALLQELLAIELELQTDAAADDSVRLESVDTRSESPGRGVANVAKSLGQKERTLENVLDSYLKRFPGKADLVRNTFESFQESNVATRDTTAFKTLDSRYQFIAEIARGGTGAVWRVYDQRLQRESAVKVLLDSRNNSEMRRRLEQEARLCGRLQHPGIVPVHELGHFDDGRPFISMKLIEGMTLAQKLESKKKTSQTELLEIVRRVCLAMGHAHEKGIVHRDLKPGNIMVGAFDEVQVMDWGLGKDLSWRSDEKSPASSGSSTIEAASADHDTALTLAGTVFGTLAYMSPEQAQAKTDAVDQRSDVFSLGAVLFRIVTGQTLYSGSDALSLLNMAQSADTSPAWKLLRKAKAARPLKSLIKNCLATRPSDRPANAIQVAERLHQVLNPRIRSGRWAALILLIIVLYEVVSFFILTVEIK